MYFSDRASKPADIAFYLILAGSGGILACETHFASRTCGSVAVVYQCILSYFLSMIARDIFASLPKSGIQITGSGMSFDVETWGFST